MVYIDDMQAPYRGMLMSHMVADTKEELIAMAKAIGVNPKWIQEEGNYQEHFDVCQSMKAKAIKLGAMAITGRQLVTITWSRPNAPKRVKALLNKWNEEDSLRIGKDPVCEATSICQHIGNGRKPCAIKGCELFRATAKREKIAAFKGISLEQKWKARNAMRQN